MNDGVNTLARVATGCRAPSIPGRIMFAPDFEDGGNPTTNGVSVAEEEKITSVEVVVKAFPADNRPCTTLAPHMFEMDGQQLTAIGGQQHIATLLNTDKSEGHGFEADIECVPGATVWVMISVDNLTGTTNEPRTVGVGFVARF